MHILRTSHRYYSPKRLNENINNGINKPVLRTSLDIGAYSIRLACCHCCCCFLCYIDGMFSILTWTIELFVPTCLSRKSRIVEYMHTMFFFLPSCFFLLHPLLMHAHEWTWRKPFEACFDCIRDINAFLEQLFFWPRECGDSIKKCSSSCPAPFWKDESNGYH